MYPIECPNRDYMFGDRNEPFCKLFKDEFPKPCPYRVVKPDYCPLKEDE